VVLRYALLGLLASRPMSGYELAKLFDGELHVLWSAKHSQIYPELARLLDEGLIRQSATGPRRRRTYAITAAGRSAVRTWLLDSEPDRSVRQEAMLRVLFLWLLEPGQAEAYLRREEELHRAQLAVLREVQRIRPSGPAQKAQHLAREWGLRFEKALADWSAWARKRVADGYLQSPD
jgi:DNA-binding PadR family transcriptional regulator